MNTSLPVGVLIWTVIRFGLPYALSFAGVDIAISLLLYIAGIAFIYLASGVNIVKQWNRRPVMRLGKYVATLGPGVRWVDPILNSVMEDYSIQDFAISLEIENVQTHDNVPITCTFIVTMNIIEERVKDYVTKASNSWKAAQNRAVAVAAECISSTELDGILHEREQLSQSMQQKLQSRVAGWGLRITAIELKDIKITDESVGEAMAMKARARKEGEAELARAKIQQEIAKELHVAAAIYDVASWKLKGFETLLELCRSADNNTILIPTDVLEAVAKLSGKS